MLKKYLPQFLLVVISLAWLGIFGTLTQMAEQGRIYPDSTSYCEAARNLYVYCRGHNYRPMLMAAINGVPYLFGASDAAVYDFSYYVNLFCWIATTLVLYAMLRRFLSKWAAFSWAVTSIFMIGGVSLIFHLLSEQIYIFMIIAGFFALMRYYENRSINWLAVGVSIFLLSMLVRPGSKFLGILITLYFAREIYRNHRRRAMLVIYGSIALILLQCAGLKYQFGNFTISYIDAVTFYNYMGQKALDIRDGKEFVQMTNPRGEHIFSLPMPEQKRVAADDFRDQLTNNAPNLFRAYLSDLIENSKTGSTPLWDCTNVLHKPDFETAKMALFNLSKWQNRILSVAGVILAILFSWRIRKQPLYGLIGAYILYVVVLSGVSCGQGDRFHLVTFPFVILLAARLIWEKASDQTVR